MPLSQAMSGLQAYCQLAISPRLHRRSFLRLRQTRAPPLHPCGQPHRPSCAPLRKASKLRATFPGPSSWSAGTLCTRGSPFCTARTWHPPDNGPTAQRTARRRTRQQRQQLLRVVLHRSATKQKSSLALQVGDILVATRLSVSHALSLVQD